MYNDDLFELILPFIKISISATTYDILCSVNKLFYKELKNDRDIQYVEEWFRNKSEYFFWENTSIYYLNSMRINNSVEFRIITSCRGTKEEEHLGIVSFNDDRTITMSIIDTNTNKENKSFSNIKTLKMMKKILINNNFHSCRRRSNR